MSEVGTLTGILVNFASIYKNAVLNISPYAIRIFGSLLLIDFTWSAIQNLLNEDAKFLPMVFRKLFKYGVYSWIINTYATQADRILDTFLKIGLVAGGNIVTAQTLTDPSYIIDIGLRTIWPILATLKDAGIFDINARMIILLLSYVFSLFAYLVIAAQVFMTYLEFYIISGVAIYFVPFAILDKTAFLAEKAIGAIIAVGVKVMLVAFILSATFPFLEQIKIETVDVEQCFKFLCAVMVVAYLAAKTPGMAAGLLSGSPSLSGGQAIAAGVMMTTTLAKVLTGGFSRVETMLSSMQGGSAAGAYATDLMKFASDQSGSGPSTVGSVANAAGNSGGGSDGSGSAKGPSLASSMNAESLAAKIRTPGSSGSSQGGGSDGSSLAAGMSTESQAARITPPGSSDSSGSNMGGSSGGSSPGAGMKGYVPIQGGLIDRLAKQDSSRGGTVTEATAPNAPLQSPAATMTAESIAARIRSDRN